jgi:hypothetical protein
MRIRRDRPVTRGLGALMGLGFVALGLAPALGVTSWPDGVGGVRAVAVGLLLVAGGLAAVIASLTLADPGQVW